MRLSLARGEARIDDRRRGRGCLCSSADGCSQSTSPVALGLGMERFDKGSSLNIYKSKGGSVSMDYMCSLESFSIEESNNIGSTLFYHLTFHNFMHAFGRIGTHSALSTGTFP